MTAFQEDRMVRKLVSTSPWLIATLLGQFVSGALPDFEFKSKLASYLKDEWRALSEADRNWLVVEEARRAIEANPYAEEHLLNSELKEEPLI